MASDERPAARQWYDDASEDDASHLLEALTDAGRAESAMLRRMRDHLGVNETDLAALELVMGAKARDAAITPTDLRDHLGVTMASVTVMIDRLERSGLVARRMDPRDRRRRLVTTTPAADQQVGGALRLRDERMAAAAAGLDEARVETIVAFLVRAAAAVQAVPAAV